MGVSEHAHRRWHRRGGGSIGLASVLLWPMLWASLLGCGGCYGLNLSLSRYEIDQRGPTPRCDAIIVPGCPARTDGTPSTCIRRRVDAAVAALQQGVSAHIIVSGGAAHNAVNEAQVMAAYARSRGVDDAALILEPYAHHTVQNLRFSSQILRAHGWRSALLVTDAVQLPFALALADRLGISAWGRLSHPPLRPRLARQSFELDALEPLPRRLWF